MDTVGVSGDAATVVAGADGLTATARASEENRAAPAIASAVGSAATEMAPGGPTLATGSVFRATPRGSAPTRLGRYVILEVLGRGGMGVVYAAFDPQLDRKVAVKLLHPELALHGEDAAARLLREGRAIAKLAHPNVVTVYDVGAHDEGVFVAMELVRGASLDVWLRAQPRSWREVIDVFLQAGAGLASAHAIGMVHRDFKPANVLMGDDGRVRVTDFGLARLGAEAVLELPASVDAFEGDSANGLLQLTATGAVVGTPAYMPPEQFEAGDVDAASDQFSFAVAVYEGLYGERPFAGQTRGEVLDNIREERVRPAPERTGVPTWLRTAVLRGLRAAKGDRYPSLGAMLHALADDPRRRRRKIGYAAAAGAFALGGIVMAMSATTDGPSCEVSGHALDGLWDTHVRGKVERAFGAVDAPYARDQLAAVTSGLDAYAEQWRAMKREACEAANVRGEQTAAQHGLRTLCLEQRLVELAAVTDVLAHADADVVRNAQRAIESLQPISTCADLRALTARVPEPADVATRIRVDAVRHGLASARAFGAAGKFETALALSARLEDEAQGTGYRPLIAEAHLLTGAVAARSGDAPRATRELTLAVQAAVAGRDDLAAARAWSELAHAHLSLAHVDRAQEDTAYATAAVEGFGGDREVALIVDRARQAVLATKGEFVDASAIAERTLDARRRQLPPDPAAIAAALEEVGERQRELGKFKRAVASQAEVLAIRERLLGSQHPDVATALHRLGRAQTNAGEFAAADQSMRRALAIRQATLVAGHPDIAELRADLSTVLSEQARYDESEALVQEALGMFETLYGAQHPAIARTLQILAANRVRAKNYQGAAEVLGRAIAIQLAVAPEHPDLQRYYGTLSQVQSRLGDFDGALASAHKALDIAERQLGKEHYSTGLQHEHLAELYLVAEPPHMEQALDQLQQALAIVERSLGKDNPHLATTLSNLCSTLGELKRHDEATAACARALAIDEAALGKDHPSLGYDLVGLGIQYEAAGRLEEAGKLYERTLGLRGMDADHRQRAQAQFRLATLMWNRGDKARARDLMARAGRSAKQGGNTSIERYAAKWLTTHSL